MKRIPNIAVMPHGFELVRGSDEASAFDIRVPEDIVVTRDQPVEVMLGIRTEVDECQLALLAPRSGLGSRGLRLCNTVGFIDTDFRGQWKAHLVLEAWSEEETLFFSRGERILQVAFVDTSDEVHYVAEEDLSTTARGEGGHGSTGVN